MVEISTDLLRLFAIDWEVLSKVMFVIIPENKVLTRVGFEPTHPKILRPERSALDRSAILPVISTASSVFSFYFGWLRFSIDLLRFFCH